MATVARASAYPGEQGDDDVAKNNTCPLGCTVVSGCGHPRCLTCPSLNPSKASPVTSVVEPTRF